VALLALFGCDDDGGSGSDSDGGGGATGEQPDAAGAGIDGGGEGGPCYRPPEPAQTSTVTLSAPGTPYDGLDGWVFTSSGRDTLGIAMGISAAGDRCDVVYVVELYMPQPAVGAIAVDALDDPSRNVVLGLNGQLTVARVTRLDEPDQLFSGDATPVLASASGTIILDRLDLGTGNDNFIDYDYAGSFEVVFTDLEGGDDITLSGTFEEVPLPEDE